MNPLAEYVSLAEAAEELYYTPRHLWTLARDGKIKGFKIRGKWMVELASVRARARAKTARQRRKLVIQVRQDFRAKKGAD